MVKKEKKEVFPLHQDQAIAMMDKEKADDDSDLAVGAYSYSSEKDTLHRHPKGLAMEDVSTEEGNYGGGFSLLRKKDLGGGALLLVGGYKLFIVGIFCSFLFV